MIQSLRNYEDGRPSHSGQYQVILWPRLRAAVLEGQSSSLDAAGRDKTNNGRGAYRNKAVLYALSVIGRRPDRGGKPAAARGPFLSSSLEAVLYSIPFSSLWLEKRRELREEKRREERKTVSYNVFSSSCFFFSFLFFSFLYQSIDRRRSDGRESVWVKGIVSTIIFPTFLITLIVKGKESPSCCDPASLPLLPPPANTRRVPLEKKGDRTGHSQMRTMALIGDSRLRNLVRISVKESQRLNRG